MYTLASFSIVDVVALWQVERRQRPRTSLHGPVFPAPLKASTLCCQGRWRNIVLALIAVSTILARQSKELQWFVRDWIQCAARAQGLRASAFIQNTPSCSESKLVQQREAPSMAGEYLQLDLPNCRARFPCNKHSSHRK